MRNIKCQPDVTICMQAKLSCMSSILLLSILTDQEARAHTIIVLRIMPDNFTCQGDETCALSQ